MKYKLLVLDVDGTLLNDAKEISKRTLAALLKVQQMGVRIVLASGRPTYGINAAGKVRCSNLETMEVLSFPIMAVRLSMHKTEKFCLNVGLIPKCCRIWKRKPVKRFCFIHLS